MLQWADTFNRYGTNAALMLDGLYASNATASIVADPDPSSTVKVLKLTQAAGGGFSQSGRIAFPGGATATIGIACRMWISALPNAIHYNPGIQLSDISNVTQIGLIILPSGALTLVRGGSIAGGGGATTIATTSIPIISPNSWNHVELKAKINSSTGTFQVRVNGVTVSELNLTGLNTQNSGNASAAQVSFCNGHESDSSGNNPDLYIKDFIIWDTTGTFNNDFLGSVSVLDIDTNADTSLTWTPSTGTVGWSILDNNPPLDDAAYIAAATPLSNTFGLGNLPADTTSVRGLVLINRTKKIDGGDGNVQMGIISGASTGLGTDRPITTAYTYWRDVMEADPATGAQFTPSAFNAASFKLARTV